MTSTREGGAPDRIGADILAIHAAAAELGLDAVTAEPVSLGRTGIYRVQIITGRSRHGFPAGTSVQAAQVTRDTDSITPPREMHALVLAVHEHGGPVPAPRHPDIVTTSLGQVGFWEWLEHTPITPREWGALTGAFHRAGRHLHHHRIYDPHRAFHTRVQRARELVAHRGHPLFGAHALLRSFEDALESAVSSATLAASAASSAARLVHGDNQPANVMRNAEGPVLNDFERIVTGPPELDLAAVVLGLQHYGYPAGAGPEFLAGYGADAPSLDAAVPYARIRELSGVAVAMIQAGDSPQMEREMHIRTTAITDPGQGDRWTYIHPQNARRATTEPPTFSAAPLTHPIARTDS